MSKNLGSYQQGIQHIMGCSDDDTVMIEHIMREDVLHTVGLDWLSAKEFATATRKAAKLLDANRAEYEEYFAATRKAFEEMRAARTAHP